MIKILDGIRVVDWTIFHQGPAAGAMLGDLGAEVIHVEDRIHGDPMRGFGTVSSGVNVVLPNGKHAMVEDLNRNKKGLALDLRKAKGKEIVRKLVEKSDVFITNYRPAAVKKLGLDYDSLKTLNQRLIYVGATAFGDKGPMADSPGLEMTGFATSGAMLASGEQGMPPISLPLGSADRVGAIFVAYGVIGGLLARERFGIGQEIKTSQLGAMITLESTALIIQLLTGKDVRRPAREESHNPLYSWYRCKDDRWIVFGCGQSDRYWSTFCRGLGTPELENDPRFANATARTANHKDLIRILDSTFATRTCEEWEKRFAEAGDIIFARINAISDLETNPQVLANGYITEWEHPGVGKQKAVGFPVEWTETPASLRLPAPEVGEHTEEILTGLLGYSWEDVNTLRVEEVI